MSVLPAPPVARREPVSTELCGERRVDDYRWLQNREDPGVVAYLEAENAYARALLAPTEALQERLYQEMVSRIQETDLSVPYPLGQYEYFSRTVQGAQYPFYYRRPRAGGGAEELLLDLNALGAGHEFVALQAFEVSDDGRRLAYSLDFTGFREYTLFVKDLETGELGPEAIPMTASVAWAADNRTLFYVTEDAAKRPYRLHRHDVTTQADALLREEKDERFRVWVQRSRSGEYLLSGSGSLTADEVGFLRAAEPLGEFTLIAPRSPDHEYQVEHRGDRFYIRTNSGGRNFRVVTTPVQDPGPEHWSELLPHDPAIMREDLDLFAGHLVVQEREAGLPHLRVRDLDTGAEHRVAFPEPVYELSGEENRVFQTACYRFAYSSPVQSRGVFDYDMVTRERSLLKQELVLGGYDPTLYAAERQWATATDGTRIPISLVYRRDLRQAGPQPLHLIGYGSYGYSYPVSFSSTRVSLLDRGVVVALAHIRGGGELGKPWHDQGRMLNKRNSFTDFVAVAEHLLQEGWTERDRLTIQGGSAGGLLMGAVLHLRPDLCRAALVLVPFVDVLNTMSDPTLPLTVGEFEEWGNPSIPEQYAYIRSYCPYTNLRAASYPALLVKTSLNDSQVMYWEPAKYVARLRTLHLGPQPILFHTNLAGGHGGSSGRYDRLRETAMDYAFLLRQLGLADR